MPSSGAGIAAGNAAVSGRRNVAPGEFKGAGDAQLRARGAHHRDAGLTDAQLGHELRREGFAPDRVSAFLRGDLEPEAGAPPAAPAPSSSSSSPAVRRTTSSRGGSAGGLLAAVFLYPIALAYLQRGPAGVKGWFKAKFLNQTSADPGINAEAAVWATRGPGAGGAAQATAGPDAAAGATPAAFLNGGAGGGGVSTTPFEGRTKVRTGSYNVHSTTSGGQTKADLAKLTKSADVLQLQEVQGAKRRQGLAAYLASLGWGFYEGQNDTAVAWDQRRYEAVQAGSAALNPNHAGKAGLMHRFATYVLLQDRSTGQQFWQVSVHTVPKRNATHTTGTPAQRAAVEAEQHHNIQALYDRLASTGLPVMLGGDLNTNTSAIRGARSNWGRQRVFEILSQLGATNSKLIRGLNSDHDAVVATYVLGAGGSPPIPSSRASSAAAGAVAFARRHLGDPYLYGGTGPHRWDCSGLIRAAYASQGVHLPRTSTSMLGSGHRVSRSQLQSGDLVWPHLGHVQLYSGSGHVIEAPHTHAFVREVPLGHVWAARRVA